MKRAELKSHCPVYFALEAFGDKWTLLVVRDMVFYGKRRYNEFLMSEEKIATNILADRLRGLIHDGIVRRTSDPRDGRKDIFLLTEKGLDLIPLLLQIEAWSGRHDPKTTMPSSFTRRILDDFDSTCAEARVAVEQGQAAACRL